MHVTGLCAVGIIFIAKANDFAIIVNGAKGMKDNEDAHAHALDVARPWLYRLRGGVN